VEQWASQQGGELERALSTLADIRASRTFDTTTLPVALREVRRLTHAANGRDTAVS
jgi:NAD-specific glutamate dehydrogenase